MTGSQNIAKGFRISQNRSSRAMESVTEDNIQLLMSQLHFPRAPHANFNNKVLLLSLEEINSFSPEG
ncbi:hypothetical protein Y1Q_0016585 [Alligator mississippiensis]|uniref:Uncharacterized protein n=1 Tax=Alligator mississippiensis TaxID=8496 RepID=A0A151MJW8_ALLMI|nr:hypothetical protein Y1Q_0016585 [Alligator mississippiensis]